ncbi:MAG TPA: glycosyltransferase family A protein [Capillimicrobium sp.]|nr:glycosyltransferase family A protein [Capillimicrobium sp.]
MVEVSVIVPARDAAATLPATLRALAAQSFDGGYEVIVVDDRSIDATAALAREAGARVLATLDGGGPAEARNLGARVARGRLLAFTDADCEPHRDWLAHGVAALRGGAELVQGPIRPLAGAPRGPFDRTLHVEGASPLFETANLLVTREAFERAGGFPAVPSGDGAAAKSFAEDTLFGWAVRRSGARAAFAADAVVHHAVFPRGPRGYVAERRRLERFPELVRQVPELREHLTAGLFLSRRTAAFDLAVAGVLAAAALRRPWPLALAVPYCRVVGAPWPPRRSVARRFAADVAADAVGLAALVRGGLRSRTAIL